MTVILFFHTIGKQGVQYPFHQLFFCVCILCVLALRHKF